MAHVVKSDAVPLNPDGPFGNEAVFNANTNEPPTFGVGSVDGMPFATSFAVTLS